MGKYLKENSLAVKYMIQYKWIALSNTTMGVLMATINTNIVLISLPSIFRGIGLDPLAPDAFQYLLWTLFGFSIVTSVLLMMFGRISDIFGRVRLFNLGFAVFTAGSIMLYLVPSTGTLGASEIVLFRIIQGIGAAFIFSNSTAILTDAFPVNERGKALGINQVANLVGSLLGFILGGILAAFDWRFVFLVSVPVGILGTLWSYWKLKEKSKINKNKKLDFWGTATFGIGLTMILIGITYGLLPYDTSSMGWNNPLVIASLVFGAALLFAFPLIEKRIQQPMFHLELFKIRMFAAASISNFLSSVGRGGTMIVLIVLLQGIWLPLHGYSYESTPFWSGIYLTPMLIGFAIMGPLSGWLSDRTGARFLSTLGMIITAVSFVLLTLLPYNFEFPTFAAIIFAMGIGGGMFAAPNTASLMNSVPPQHRGSASGINATLNITGQTVSIALFFTIIINALAGSLPSALNQSMADAGALHLAPFLTKIPPTVALFADFLGYNPMVVILNNIPSYIINTMPEGLKTTISGASFFPNATAPSFMSALDYSFYIGAGLSICSALSAALRGKVFIHDIESKKNKVNTPQPIYNKNELNSTKNNKSNHLPERKYSKEKPE